MNMHSDFRMDVQQEHKTGRFLTRRLADVTLTPNATPTATHSEAGGSPVSGWTAPGFEPVRATFERNFADGQELGAACAAYVESAPVVDLWGGFRDRARRKPWERETMVPVFSTTKGMAS